MNKKQFNKQAGFTLLEMLIVVVIMGILATVLLTNMSSARQRARDAARKSDMRMIKTALRLYYNDYQKYPDGSSGNIMGCGSGGTSACTWGVSAFTAGTTQYMAVLPKDPLDKNLNKYTYQLAGGGDTFILQTYLENASDGDAAASVARCINAGATSAPQKYVVCAD
jgi:general secretion pathway protein G